MLLKLASWSGLMAAVWIVIGVSIAGKMTSGYSHVRQLCSELGAVGSPTEKISPWINNYPLGSLFGAFGGYIVATTASVPEIIAGWLIALHGLGTIVAGYFPMDADPYTKTPTRQCRVHLLAGVFMLVSLLLAPLLVLGSDVSWHFKLFTLVCLLLCMVFLFLLGREYQRRGQVGLYQRLSYGAQLVWLAGYSYLVS